MLKKLRVLKRLRSLEADVAAMAIQIHENQETIAKVNASLEALATRFHHIQEQTIVCAGKCGGLFFAASGKLCKLEAKDAKGNDITEWYCIRCRGSAPHAAGRKRRRK